jgi:hypothetical protein
MRRSSRNSCRATGAVLAWLLATTVPPAAAQTTLDGSYCIVFDGTIHGELARCARLLRTGHPLQATTLTLALIGDAPDRIHHVAISLDGATAFQSLPVNATPPLSHSDVGILFADMNFDAFIDFGVMTTATAGPAGTYQWFVFRPDEGKFSASARLSALTGPRTDPASRRIVSERRSAPAGFDLYRWQAGMLVLDERVERTCIGGRCSCRHLRPQRHGFALSGSGPCT